MLEQRAGLVVGLVVRFVVGVIRRGQGLDRGTLVEQAGGLELIDAETLPQGSIKRLRYEPADGTSPEEGLLAFARALEHINLFWTWCGMILRLPILHQAIQFILDLSGFGPLTIPGACPDKRSLSKAWRRI